MPFIEALSRFINRFRRAIPTCDLPRVLSTKTEGNLHLTVRYMIFRAGQLEFIDEDALYPGNEIRMRFCRYAPSTKASGPDAEVSFHPPDSGCANPSSWVEVVDKLCPVVRASWREMLRTNPNVIEKLFCDYGNESLTLEAVLPSLKVRHIKISADASFELGFEMFEPFPSLDMSVEFAPDRRVVRASFGG